MVRGSWCWVVHGWVHMLLMVTVHNSGVMRNWFVMPWSFSFGLMVSWSSRMLCGFVLHENFVVVNFRSMFGSSVSRLLDFMLCLFFGWLGMFLLSVFLLLSCVFGGFFGSGLLSFLNSFLPRHHMSFLRLQELFEKRLWDFDVLDMATFMANESSGFVRLSWNLNVSNLRLRRRHLNVPWLWGSDVMGLLDVLGLLRHVVRSLLDVSLAWCLRVIWLLDILWFSSVHGLTVIGLVWRNILVWHVDVAVFV